MHSIRKRFTAYALIGLFFGILDWFYLDWLAHFQWGALSESLLVIPFILLMNYGIWFVPVIPVAIHETGRSGSIRSPMLAGSLLWSCAILSYYAYYAILLSTGKLPHLAHLNIFGEKYDTFWPEYWQMFKGIIIGQVFEWIFIAIAGGAIIGALVYWLFRKKHPRLSKSGELPQAGR